MDIGGHPIGAGHPVFVVAEIGINHNGDVEIAKRLIDAAKQAGCDAVKFQKRTPELCVPRDQWGIPKETPWGMMPYLEYKQRLEFNDYEYHVIDAYCKQVGMLWFASCWDVPSVEFIERFNPPCYKIASATLTDDFVIEHTRWNGKPIILSTGMSTWEQIDNALNWVGHPVEAHTLAYKPSDNLVLMHARSTYPAALDELNLNMIPTLRERYGVPVGYSGHEVGLATTLAAVAFGACVIERHITLDRAMWGTDQAASVEPQGFARLVKDIRNIERAMGDGQQREYASEEPIRRKLRGN